MLDLDMSPHGVFIWGAWGMTLVALVSLVLRAWLSSRRWKKDLNRLEGKDQ